jgi:type II secretory pathway component GspD/PulD (secretin)
LFVENSGAGARGSGRNNTAAQKPVIVADDATNSLIVRAAPADYNLIEKLAISLDEEGGDVSKRFKIIQVSSAYKVADIAGSLEETLRATAMPSGDGRNAQRNEVSVQAIPASNTLVLAGDPKQLAVAEALVKQLQEMGPPGGRKQLIINTKNMSAEEIKRVLDEMLEQNSGGTGSSGGRSQGSTPRRNSGGGRRPR